MGSKTVLIGKLALVFFISLLSFSVGTFVGKKYSDNQHQLAALEPGKKSAHGEEVASGHGDAGHGEANHGEAAGHGEAAATEGHGEPTRETASTNGGTMSDEEIAKLAEEFVADDTHTVSAKNDHGDSHGDAHAEAAHGAPAATAEKSHGETTAKARTTASTHETAKAETVATTEKPAASKLREHNPSSTTVEGRVPTSLPKEVGQYQPARFTVQVAAYTDEAEAKKMATDLKGQGYSAFYVPTLVKGKTYYRVSVGQFATQQEASLFKAELVEKAKVGSAFVQKITQ